jgi:hypothetical protein
MVDKEKIIRELGKGYAPRGEGAKPRIAKVYDLTFKPLVNSNKLEFFLELYERNDPILNAWAILGIYQILQNKSYEREQTLNRLHEIMMDLLNKDQKISFWSGSIKTETTLREHHAKRIGWLDPYFVFEPIYEYCKASIGHLDNVIGALLEDVLSKRPDERIEDLLIQHGKQVGKSDYDAKLHLIRAFENLNEYSDFENRQQITDIFKQYLNSLKHVGDEEEIDEKKRRILKDEIIRIAAKLRLDLKEETLSFIKQLERPFNALNQVAERYKDNDRFRSILLEKIQETRNRYFITDILRAFMVLKDRIDNWEEMVIDYVKKYELNDADLIIDLNKANLLSEEMLVNYLKKGSEWHLEFIREFLTTHPEKIDEWKELRNELVSILEIFKGDGAEIRPGSLFYEKKKLALRLVVDLKWDEMIDLALKNFEILSDDELMKIALFAVITSRDKKLLDELRALMDKDEQTEAYVKKFWRYLEARDWQFFY